MTNVPAQSHPHCHSEQRSFCAAKDLNVSFKQENRLAALNAI